MSRSGEIAWAFLEQGWEIRYRGGNALCSTPSDLDLVVADAPGDPPRYSIAAWPSSSEPPGAAVFDLHDAERGVIVRVRRVPTPESASELLGRYGVPDNGTRDAPLVPEAAEGPVHP